MRLAPAKGLQDRVPCVLVSEMQIAEASATSLAPDKAHGIGTDIGVVNSHKGDPARIKGTGLYGAIQLLEANPELPRQCNRSLQGVVSGSVN